jgi:hypothetical protein
VTVAQGGAAGQAGPSAVTRPVMQASRPSATLFTWQGVAEPRLESVRVLLTENRLRASGRLIAAGEAADEAYSASFELSTDEGGVVSRLLLRSTTADEERQLSLSRTEDEVWLFDHGTGAERDEFDGACDVDVLGAVLFNTLPVRRLGLHREPGTHDLPMVFVTLPDLSVTLSRQTYRTVSVHGDGAVVNYASDGFTADLAVDAEGFVVDYPGLARRL